MKSHRIRLTDIEIADITASLRARMAMSKGSRRHRLARLNERLSELRPGNPKWIIDEASQTHEDDPTYSDEEE